ncbi:very short patch repair endonuclease [Lysobacter sp. GX 14042]|uniref:very short patch repair endonuclease n=1 Tax=Lysobacter sp. GX 14042 TaxID=2907155 RepID=UPI001F32CC9F|nr:very short patch repair endonuclease [Lysobacter sp. GX 14042]MCE7032870.1 very short patch repair endonuclease [Lysobacter sp. GX 14042]
MKKSRFTENKVVAIFKQPVPAGALARDGAVPGASAPTPGASVDGKAYAFPSADTQVKRRPLMDIVKKDVRSRMMSGIRGKDTKPELVVRRYLHGRGFRFRLHERRLPGRPDLVLAKWGAVVFVHGCFWHGHEDCRYFRVPATRTEFWVGKIRGNAKRDAENERKLLEMGWRVIVIWECAIRNDQEKALCELAKHIRGAVVAAQIESEPDQLSTRAE